MGDDNKRAGFIERTGEAARDWFDGAAGARPSGTGAAAATGDVADTRTDGHYGAQGHASGPRSDGYVRVGGNMAAGSSAPAAYRDDPHYHETRDRHLASFDRDYDDYRREHAATPTNDYAGGDFGAWHRQRLTSHAVPTHVREHGQVASGEVVDPSSRALSEAPNTGDNGPHVLDRSFAGTYDN